MATVIISVSEYVSPGSYNPIELSFHPSNQVCYVEKSSYQISTSELELESIIYNEDDSPAAIGWYSDGHNRAQWNGTEIITFEPCEVLWEPSEPYCIQDDTTSYSYLFSPFYTESAAACGTIEDPFITLYSADESIDLGVTVMYINPELTGEYVVNQWAKLIATSGTSITNVSYFINLDGLVTDSFDCV